MAGVYSVSQVNAYIKNMFAQDFALNRISVKGEVSNCKYHTSGHIYFTLKDGLGAMQAVMFASRRKGLTFRLEEGQQVVVKGSIEVYERDGRYQLYASEITLDGTEEIYNRSKAFIYKDGQSPYQVVLANIQRLLDAGVSVHIRLNMDEHNADNLMELADELHERFGGKGKFSVYSHTLFEFAGSKAHIRAQEERRQLYQKQQRLRKKLDDCGIGASYYLRQKLRVRQCMADSGGSLTILPNGELGLCEHYSEDNFVGSLDGKASERSVIQSFREYWEPIEECKTCFYYPECIRLKKCAEQKECFEELRAEYKEYLLKSMQKNYNAWLKKEQIDEEEPHPDC